MPFIQLQRLVRRGGNIQTKAAKCDGLIAKYKHEAEGALEPLNGETDVSCGLAAAPVSLALLSPPEVHGWYRTPLVTLSAEDRDGDLERTEYRLDDGAWTIYTSPFTSPVTDDTRCATARSISSITSNQRER